MKKKKESVLSDEEQEILDDYKEIINKVGKAEDEVSSTIFFSLIENKILSKLDKVPINSEFKVLKEIRDLRGVATNAGELYPQLINYLRRITPPEE